MAISQKMSKAINEQIGRELGASLQYTAIATYFEARSLPRLASYFAKQADEERGHAMRFVRYLVDVGAKVAFPAVAAPKSEFGTAEEPVRLSLRWEEDVTKQIYGLLEIALKENDYMTQQFLQWFIEEQREEVASMQKLLDVVRLAGESGLLLVEDYIAREGHPEDAAKD